ncbi:MAG: thiosulfate oxidation carrier protein SoxY [Ramlibacter sp.]
MHEMPTRRDTLKHSLAVASLLGATGLLPQTARAFTRAAFDARNLGEAARAYGATAPIESHDVQLTAPELAENGAVVAFTIASTLSNVKALLLLVEKNPSVLVAKFDVTDAVDPNFALRAKMAETSNVYAVAITADNKAWFARKQVQVTLGGCG